MSQLKIKDNNDNWIDIPASGVGVPSGGSAGDVLVKSSAVDYATEWQAPLVEESFQVTPTVTFTSVDVNKCRKCGNLVTINFTGRATSGASATWLSVVSIPSEYAPTGEVLTTCVISDAVAMCSVLQVSGQWVITVSPKYSANAKISLNVSYII